MEKEENIKTQNISTEQKDNEKTESVDNSKTSVLEEDNEISSVKNDETLELKEDDIKQPIEKNSEEKILELEDKLARTFAEMENQRRRFEKEKIEAYEYGGFAFAKEALSLIDNLERSRQILENDESLKKTEALKKTIEHFSIIYKDLISVFEKNNIKSIDSLNKKLDPNLHQAMIEIEDNQKDPGTIVQEIQKGFTIKDRLLRPALVGVSKKSSNNDKKDEENKENLDNK